jgi:anti-sigma B factor antagonist
MEIDLPPSPHDDWTVVSPSGEIDVAAAPRLRELLTDLVNDESVNLVIDLDNTDFIDSTGLGVLVGALRRARSAGGDVRLACTNSRILKVIDITGLDEVFAVGASVDDAISLATVE